jgi:hypothetical protein
MPLQNDDSGDDFKDVVYPPASAKVAAWKAEARALLDRLRAGPVCLVMGTEHNQADASFVDGLPWAKDCEALIYCESRRNRAEVICRYAKLEHAIADDGGQVFGPVKVTAAIHDDERADRDMVQASILFPFVEAAWWDGGREIDWAGQKWAHRGELGYQFQVDGLQPETRKITILHLGLPAAAALVLFLLPHGIRPAVVIENPGQ